MADGHSTTSKPKPVLAALAVLAALDVLTAGAAFADFVGKDTTALIVLILAAINVGVGVYLTSVVTPVSNVVAYQPDPDRYPQVIIAGGAAASPTGSTINPVHTIGETVNKV